MTDKQPTSADEEPESIQWIENALDSFVGCGRDTRESFRGAGTDR
jgi:hypothetical protein